MKSKTRKKNPHASARSRTSTASRGNSSGARRLLVTLFTTGIVGLQATSCGLAPPALQTAPAPSSTAVAGAGASAGRFQDCPQYFAGGRPPVTPAAPHLRALCFDGFAVLHSGNTRTPVYVAERLNRQSLLAGRHLQRTDRFFADARLPRSERAELSDYKGSGWARGHMAPAGDMGTPEAMAQSFSLSNMVPQNPRQNSGPWARIEDDTRKYALRAQGDVYVITGPVFEPGARTIGPGHVAVPAHLFKLVYDPATGRRWAHWQDNAPDAKAGPPISYEEVVRRTGIDLLPGLRS